MTRKVIPIRERIHSRIDKTDECWIWKGSSRNGQPNTLPTRIDGMVIGISPRRWMYEDAYGKLEPNQIVVMSCRQSLCLNPAHMNTTKRGAHKHSVLHICFSGEALKRERIKRSMSQRYLAEQVGVSLDVVRRWENGYTQPSATYLLRIQALFGVRYTPLILSK
jgi:DNA-binding transcriptional regulator YiaG